MKQVESLLKKYNIEDLAALEKRLQQSELMNNQNVVCLDIHEYNSLLKELNEFLLIERELGANLIGFIKHFMKGDALWAYNTEKKVIGEMKVENPFAHEITVKRIEKEPLLKDYDKKKLN